MSIFDSEWIHWVEPIRIGQISSNKGFHLAEYQRKLAIRLV